MMADDSDSSGGSGGAVTPPTQEDDQQSPVTQQQSTTPTSQQAQRDDTPTNQDSEEEGEADDDEEDEQDDDEDADGHSRNESDDQVSVGVPVGDGSLKNGLKSPATTENEQQQPFDEENPLGNSDDSSPPFDASVRLEELEDTTSSAALSVETNTANDQAAHLPHAVGANMMTPSGAHPMYPSFPVTGMAGTGAAVSPSHPLQFPYASSNFVAPMPTPIRPLHGDPRATTQQQVAAVNGGGGSDDANPDTEAAAANSPEGTSIPYPVPASRMFHHQTNSPSFYNTAQDGPPVGPSAVDPNFQKPWDGSVDGTPALPNDPNWSSNQMQPVVASQPEPPHSESNKVRSKQLIIMPLFLDVIDCEISFLFRFILPCSLRLCQIQVCLRRHLRQARWLRSRLTTACTGLTERTFRE